MVKNYFNFLQFVLFFIFLSVLPSQIYAQCAGTDGATVICNIENPIYKSISLFSLLGGSPTPGGTWTDDTGSRGLDKATGFLNGHLIRSGGTFEYTYTVPARPGCTTNTAKVRITISAFSGYPSEASKCTKDKTFDLFSAFNSTVIGPHLNGVWTNTLTGEIVGSTISIASLQGNFKFTYTVPPVLACSPLSKSSTIDLSVFRSPESGTAADLTLCGSTDLAAFTDLDLNTRLTGADPGGRWRGPGITTPEDHNVDLQEVFDRNGPGEYKYDYTVATEDEGTCPPETTTVLITLEKRLDFTGAKMVINSDICEDVISTATYSAVITQGAERIPDGQYKVEFNVSGPNGGSEIITGNFLNGVITFPLKSAYFKQVGIFTVNVSNIYATTGKGACVNVVNISGVLKINPLPHLDGATINPQTTCQNKSSRVQISNASQLLDGSYTITYNVTGDNFATGQKANIQVTGGNSSFIIPASTNVKSGLSTVTITNITKTSTGCTNIANIQGNLIINPLPNAATVKIQVDDFCVNNPISVQVSGLGDLTKAKISYLLSDQNSSTLQTVDLDVVNGKSSFVVPSDLTINTGLTLITATYLANDITGCDTALINVVDGFLINPIPVAPVAGNQEFCKVDRATIANLTPRGSQYKWYNSAALTTPLADNYLLKSENLYVTETSAANCTSPASTISVLVKDTPAPILNQDGQNFCGLKNPTISDLSKATNVTSTVSWYDARDNGNLIASTTLLIDKATYYGYDLSSVTDCISDSSLEVKVSLTDCDVSQYAFFIPDGFSPNGDNVNDTFRIPDIEFLYPDYTLEIFNRYGNVMFKGNVNKPNWDGRNSGSAGFGDGIAPNGVYFYVINFNKDNRKAQQGRLYLNR